MAVDFIETFAHFLELQAARVIFIHKCGGKMCVFISDIFRELLQHKFELTQTKISLFGIVKVAKHSLQGEFVLHNYFVEFLEILFYFYQRVMDSIQTYIFFSQQEHATLTFSSQQSPCRNI